MSKFAKYFCVAVLAGGLSVPVFAQYSPERQDQTRHDQQDQTRHDQDDRNRADQDRDQNRTYQDQDRDRDNNYTYSQNQRWRDSKAYQKGLKDGEHDRSKNKGQNFGRHHWKNDQDRQAYEAGYMEAYGGNTAMNRGHRRNDHDRDDNNRREQR